MTMTKGLKREPCAWVESPLFLAGMFIVAGLILLGQVKGWLQ